MLPPSRGRAKGPPRAGARKHRRRMTRQETPYAALWTARGRRQRLHQPTLGIGSYRCPSTHKNEILDGKVASGLKILLGDDLSRIGAPRARREANEPGKPISPISRKDCGRFSLSPSEGERAGVRGADRKSTRLNS